MSFLSWLGKRQRPIPSDHSHEPARKRSSYRPRLEVLEDRTVPSRGFVFQTIDVPNGTNTAALGINSTGDVVGEYSDPNGPTHGFLLSGGQYTTLDVPNALFTAADGINPRGDVVGQYADTKFNTYGFLLSGGQYTTLHAPNDAVGITVANGINDSGQIVGYYEDALHNAHGFLLSGGQYTTLDVVPNAQFTVAQGINADGQIVGYYADATGAQHGFLLSGGQYTTLDVPNAQFTAAQGINDLGQIVGVGYYADGYHDFLLSGGQYVTFHRPNFFSFVNGINDSEEIVGYYNDAHNAGHGFLAGPTQGNSPSTSTAASLSAAPTLQTTSARGLVPLASSLLNLGQPSVLTSPPWGLETLAAPRPNPAEGAPTAGTTAALSVRAADAVFAGSQAPSQDGADWLFAPLASKGN